MCQSNFCDDFNIADEQMSERMYLVYIYISFIFNLFSTFSFPLAFIYVKLVLGNLRGKIQWRYMSEKTR